MSSKSLWFFLALFFSACTKSALEDSHHLTIWHQMRVDEREILEWQIAEYMRLHPGITVEQVYKETEELRSGYIIAAIAGQGPDLVYGPSDQVGPFQVMDIIRPLDDLFEPSWLDSLNPKGLTYYEGKLYQIADKLGNHLTLIYNKDLIKKPPETDEELIAVSIDVMKSARLAGRSEIYGLTWNYTEPFFFIPFLTGFGGWVMDEDGRPTLDTPAMVDALQFIQDLRNKYKVIPREADYNIADVLFKDGKAAMIINGDWSWSGYKKAEVNFGVAPLPKVIKTGLWCAPMVSPKGYSININTPPEKIPAVIDLLKFLLSPEMQLQTAEILNTMPTWIALYGDPIIKDNEIMRGSQLQIDRGRPMPVVPELRAIWDAMRPGYQAVLADAKTPEQAAKGMQVLALQKIVEMNE